MHKLNHLDTMSLEKCIVGSSWDIEIQQETELIRQKEFYLFEEKHVTDNKT